MIDTPQTRHERPVRAEAGSPVAIPDYLRLYYPWAYVSGAAIRFWDHEGLVQGILFGQYGRLKRQVRRVFACYPGSVLQIACVYGSLSAELVDALPAQASLTLVDVLAAQLRKAASKITDSRLHLVHADSRQLPLPGQSFRKVLSFFLLHEQPAEVRQQTVREALRVLHPQGVWVIVDYDRPCAWHPCRPVVALSFRYLEPFAGDLWRQDLSSWIRALAPTVDIRKTSFFGGLYQVLEVRRSAGSTTYGQAGLPLPS